jgi:hypothetical protein
VFEDAEGAADSLRVHGAGELCAFEYAAGVAVTGAVRNDALDSLGRSRSPLVIRGSPLAPGVRMRAEGPRPSVLPDAPDASEDADELAEDCPERCARMLMRNAAGAGERGCILNADRAGAIARPAADALLPARGRVIAASNDALFPVHACSSLRARVRGERAWSARSGRASRPHAPSWCLG